MNKLIIIEDGQGFSRISGTSLDFQVNYITFEVDYLAEETDGECSLCSKAIDTGWLCLDGGEEYCWDCVLLIPCYNNGNEILNQSFVKGVVKVNVEECMSEAGGFILTFPERGDDLELRLNDLDMEEAAESMFFHDGELYIYEEWLAQRNACEG